MSRLTSKDDTQELQAVKPTFTDAEIQQGLKTWHQNLKTAQADENILGIETAHRYLNTWLDRYNARPC